MSEAKTKESVREFYGRVAKGQTSCCTCSGKRTAREQSLLIGYTPEQLAQVPPEAVLGLGCGNPTALAQLAEGQTVVDLGSGAGIDVFLAARLVGASGRVIGVDMTSEMLARGERLVGEAGLGNVEFRQGDIEHLPLEDGSADVVISNCVINLTPDKVRSFWEAHRVLRPGGRLVVSDLVTLGPLPDDLRRDARVWAECIGGALERHAYLAAIGEAGFREVSVLRQAPYDIPELDGRLSGKVASVTVRAVK